MNDFASQSEADAFIRRAIYQQVTDVEFQEFQHRLMADSQFRRRYLELVDLEVELGDICGAGQPKGQLIHGVVQQSGSQFAGSGSLGWLALVTAGLLCLTVWFLVQPPVQPIDQQETAGGDLVSAADEVTGGPKTDQTIAAGSGGFEERQPERVEDVAVVVSAEGLKDEQLRPGRRLPPGVLRFAEGVVQLEFFGGAIVAIAGPAEIHIQSKDAATLVKGVARTRVSERARGFVLNAPDSAIVDLGTEFGLQIHNDGTSEVQVASGEVQLSLLGEDGNTLVSQLLSTSQAVRVDRDHGELISVAAREESMPSFKPSTPDAMPISKDYVNAVNDDYPLIYWRFETEDNGRLPNEAGEELAASIQRAESEPQCIRIQDGTLRFEAASSPRYLLTDDLPDNFNAGPFTVEFWMKPDSMSRATLAGIFSDDRAYHHLNVIEIATETELVHEPGAIRFLHRDPPGHSLRLGKNAYTAGLCVPGQWQHIVAVRGVSDLKIYYNGQLAKLIPIKPTGTLDSYRILVGQLNVFELSRQFVGYLDEFAVYQKALPAETIAKHYELVVGEKNE